MPRNNTIGNNGPRNVLPYASNIFMGVNQNELIANGPPYSGLDYPIFCTMSSFSPAGVPFGGYGILQTDDGVASPVANLSAAGATLGTDGYQDAGAINFDGSTGYSNLGTFTNSSLVNFSLAMWIKVPNPITKVFVASILGTATPGKQFGLYVSGTGAGGGHADGTLLGDTAGPGRQAFSSGVVPFGQPVHIAVTCPNLASKIVFWINGVRQTTSLEGADVTVTSVDTTSTFHHIDAILPTVYGAGSVYKWQMFTNLLSDADVLELYSSGLANRDSWWTMWNEMPILPGIGSPSPPPPIPPTPPVSIQQLDLDRGGTARTWNAIWRGPSVGWISAPSISVLPITAAGSYTLDPSTNYVTVNVAGAVTIFLPSTRVPTGGAQAQPNLFAGVPVVVADIGGFAQANPITIRPFSATETIMGLSSIQISTNFGAFTLAPNSSTLTWNVII